MSVEIGVLLHVLAHEMRTPVGIAHGYVRLLLEGRLPEEKDRRRALEQLQKALGRLSDISHESSALADWLEREDPEAVAIGARKLLDTVLDTGFDAPVTADSSGVSADAALTTADRRELERALGSLVRATARELRGRPCTVVARERGRQLQVLIGASNEFDALADGPESEHAAPLEIDRGGLGLALVHATMVLDANGGACWSRKGSRQAVAVRLPLGQQSTNQDESLDERTR
jgi:signal transduction histidine kinase